jgi:hypothetical protein
MRRIIAVMCLLSGLVGCTHHTCGKCDCDIPGWTCPSCCGTVSMANPAARTPEPIKEMPKDLKPMPGGEAKGDDIVMPQ